MKELKPHPYFPYQKEGIEYGVKNKRFLLADEPGLGKAQPNYSKVYTVDGYVRIGDIRVGAQVLTPDGDRAVVTGVFPQGKRPIYRITFNDSSQVDCDENHLWNVRDENRRARGTGWITKTTKDILNSGLTLKPSKSRLKSGRKSALKWEIPLTEPVAFNETDVVIPPYVLGVLISEGSLTNNVVCFSNPDTDSQVKEKVLSLLPENLKLNANRHSSCPVYSITQTGTTKKNPYTTEIKRLKLDVLSGDKFIPEAYLFNSKENRVELLRGLMDGDGSCIRNRSVYHTTSWMLANDVKELVQSLGGIARVNAYDRTIEGKSIEYQVSINVPFNPFSLERKAANWKRQVFRRHIQSIELLGNMGATCIMVDHPDHLYLTDGFVVTHNTVQAIITVLRAKAFPCLIICPASLKLNWQKEVHMWTDRKAMILNDANRHSWWMFATPGMNPFGTGAKADVFITNYESLKKFFVQDIARGELKLSSITFNPQISLFKSVIIDEAHRLKEPSTQQSKFVKGIVNGKEHILALTGTPIVNSQEDLVSILGILDRLKDFGGASMFRAKWLEKSKLSELGDKLREFAFIRRRKSEVLEDLPDKMRAIFPTELSNQEEYDIALNDLKRYLIEYKQNTDAEAARKLRMKALLQVGVLKGISAIGKISTVVDHVNEVVNAGHKIVVFCHLREVGSALQVAFPDACIIRGGMSSAMKNAHVERFQNDPEAKVIICSIKAAGVGLTLTASSRVAFLELPWHPADLNQCEDRCIVEGEPILTPDGWRPVEDIKIGDLVINKDGNAVKVTDAWSKGNTKLVTEINVQGFGTLKTTNDHKFLTNKGWVEASALMPGDELLMPKQNSNPDDLKSIVFDSDCRINKTFIGQHGQTIRNGRLHVVSDEIEITDLSLFVFGYFVGDGFASVKAGKGRFISVAGHSVNKRPALEKCKTWFNHVGINHSEHQDSENGCEVRAYSGEWAMFFNKHFGQTSHGKQLPEFLMYLNERQSRMVLDGLMSSDGYFRKNRYEYVTASDKLCSQVARLILRAGFKPTVAKNSTGQHLIAYATSQNNNFAKVKSVFTHFPQKTNGKRPMVYDLTTDKTESFILGLSVVHNCHRIGQKDSVQVTYFLGRDSIDHHIYSIIDRKRAIAEAFTGDPMAVEASVKNELFELLLKEG